MLSAQGGVYKKQNMKKYLVLLLIAASCKPSQSVVNAPSNAIPGYSVGGKIFTSVYMQKAAEYRALCYQAYNAGRARIDNFVSTTNLPKAIITDIDETILDNSPYAVKQGFAGKEYDLKSWQEWTARAEADTMPGAAAFLHYAAAKGVQIFYVTNREEVERAGTLANLRKFALPNADEAHLFTRKDVSSKERRRIDLMQSYEIVLLMGDNLADFSNFFDKKSFDERKANTDALWAEFGKKFIVLPNPNYGDWEGALFKYNYKLTQAQKDSVFRATLKSYE